jgi:hypothetical protein
MHVVIHSQEARFTSKWNDFSAKQSPAMQHSPKENIMKFFKWAGKYLNNPLGLQGSYSDGNNATGK